MFRVGQKVICIQRDGWKSGKSFGDEMLPIYRMVYTVRELEMHNGLAWLRLVEIVNPIHNYGGGLIECTFRSDRFRPIVERKTDISVFTRMLREEEIV